MSKFTSDEHTHINGGSENGPPTATPHTGLQVDPDLFSGLYTLTLSTNNALLAASPATLTSQVHSVNNVGPTYASGLEYWSLSPDFLSGLGRAQVNHTTLTFTGTRSPGPVAPTGFPASDANPLFSMPALSAAWPAATSLPQSWFFANVTIGGMTVPTALTINGGSGSAPPTVTWYQNASTAVPGVVSCTTPTTFTYQLAPSSPAGWLQLSQPSMRPTPVPTNSSSPSTASMQGTSLACADGMLFQACLGPGASPSPLLAFASNDGCAWAGFSLGASPVISSAPAIAAAAGGQICLAYVDSTRTTITALKLSPSRNGTPSFAPVASHLDAPSAPALAARDATLFAAYQDAAALHVCSSTDFGKTWTAVPTPSLPTENASGAPALAALSDNTTDNLYLAVVMSGNITVFSSSDINGSSWAQVATLSPAPKVSWSGVALAAYNGALYLAAASSSGLQVMQSTDDGRNWSAPASQSWPLTNPTNPAMSALGGSLLVVSYIQAGSVNYAYLR